MTLAAGTTGADSTPLCPTLLGAISIIFGSMPGSLESLEELDASCGRLLMILGGNCGGNCGAEELRRDRDSVSPFRSVLLSKAFL